MTPSATPENYTTLTDVTRPGRLAFVGPAHRAAQHHANPVPRKVPRIEPAGKHLAVHARQLALKSDLQILRRHRRPLLRRMEQTHRSTLADHVDRDARLELRVLISESWYNSSFRKQRLSAYPRGQEN